MIRAAYFETLRGIDEGKIDELGPVNILVGPNNCGKSTCLEGISMALGAASGRINHVVRLLIRRGGTPLHALEGIFPVKSPRADLAAGTTLDLGDESRLRATLKIPRLRNPGFVAQALAQGLQEPLLEVHLVADGPKGQAATQTGIDARGALMIPSESAGPAADPIPWRFLDVEGARLPRALEDAYTDLENAGQLQTVVTAARVSLPGLSDLRILKSGDDFVLHTFRGDRPVPAYLAGDGFKRLLMLSAVIADARGGVVLLEEPECFQHPRYLRAVVALLREAAQAGTQVILTTHSAELIDLMLHAEPAIDGLVVHRLRLDDGRLRSTALDRVLALSARDELFEDLRA